MPHGPMDIYAQFRALNPMVFGTSFAQFKIRYAVMGGYQNYQVVSFKNEKELRSKIRQITYEVGAEVLDLPKAIHMFKECQLGAAAQKIYDNMESDFYSEVEEGDITAQNALVKLLRLRQMVGGYAPTDEGEYVKIDNSKSALLKETLEDLGSEPVVVFCQFIQDIKTVHDVCAELEIESRELSGRVKEHDEWSA